MHFRVPDVVPGLAVLGLAMLGRGRSSRRAILLTAVVGSAVYAALLSDGELVTTLYYFGVGLLCVGVPVGVSAAVRFLPAGIPSIARMMLAIAVGWAFIPITLWVWDRCCGV